MSGRRVPDDWFDRPLPENLEIGDRSWIHSAFAFLHYASARPCGVRIGHDTGLYKGTFFDLGPEGELTVGDFSTCVAAIISANTRITIGSYVLIAHDVVIADRPFAMPGAHGGWSVPGTEGRPISIADDVWIGARAIVLGGAVIGQGAIVGAGAVVDGPVPARAVVAGNPARIVRTLPPRSSDPQQP